MAPFSRRGLRAILVWLGLCVALAAVPTVAAASIGLGVVVSANPANVTPNVASGAVCKLLQVGGTMLNPTTGAVDSAFNANFASGKVTELALTGCSPAAPSRASCGP